MDERNNDFDFDFTPIGQAIKKARKSRGMTREELAGIIGYAPRHIQSIENEGQYPSIELFIQLITMFDVSVDEYIFPNKEVKKSSVRRRLDAQLDRFLHFDFLFLGVQNRHGGSNSQTEGSYINEQPCCFNLTA